MQIPIAELEWEDVENIHPDFPLSYHPQAQVLDYRENELSTEEALLQSVYSPRILPAADKKHPMKALLLSLPLYGLFILAVIWKMDGPTRPATPAATCTISLTEESIPEDFAPPPPPPPPPPAPSPAGGTVAEKKPEKNLAKVEAVKVETPPEKPSEEKIAQIVKPIAPSQSSSAPERPGQSGAIVGGVTGGVAGGQSGGVIGGTVGGQLGGVAGGTLGGVPGGKGDTVPPRFDASYLRNPQPSYPYQSRKLRERGRVLLKVLVSPSGKPERVELHKSSGYPRLDEAALEAVRHWTFVPAKRGGEAVSAWVVVPLDFRLES